MYPQCGVCFISSYRKNLAEVVLKRIYKLLDSVVHTHFQVCTVDASVKTSYSTTAGVLLVRLGLSIIVVRPYCMINQYRNPGKKFTHILRVTDI